GIRDRNVTGVQTCALPIFLLYGDVLTIGDMASRVHQAGKKVFVHLDLVDGLASREIAADFIARNTVADGVLSTKAGLCRRAKDRSEERRVGKEGRYRGPT